MTPEYSAWHAIKQRCFNPSNPQYAGYGGRGITMAAEWRHDFFAFIDHLGDKPGPSHSIDRIDNNGNYEPGNVRWATKAQQQLNRRVCLGIRRINEDGSEEAISLSQAAAYLAISYSAIRNHLIKADILQARPSDRYAR